MLVEVRNFKPEDVPEIDEIYKRQPWLSVPGLDNLVSNGTIVRTKDDKVIGYGAVKLFSELVLILDKAIPKRERAQALRESMQIAILKAKESKLEYLYAVASDQNFADVLRKHYSFQVVPGELLVLDLDSSEE